MDTSKTRKPGGWHERLFVRLTLAKQYLVPLAKTSLPSVYETHVRLPGNFPHPPPPPPPTPDPSPAAPHPLFPSFPMEAICPNVKATPKTSSSPRHQPCIGDVIPRTRLSCWQTRHTGVRCPSLQDDFFQYCLFGCPTLANRFHLWRNYSKKRDHLQVPYL